MPRWFVPGLVACWISILTTALAAGQDKAVALDGAVAIITVYAQVDPDLPTEVRVAQGSGFLVDAQQGTIITAKHIVDAKLAEYGGKRRYMVSLGGHSGQVQAQKFGECGDGTIDICILTIQAADVRRAGVEAVFQTLCVPPEVNDVIMGMGFPPGDFSVVTRVRGNIAGPRAQEQKYPSDIHIVEGMSGGPVLRDGYVIALNAGGLEVNPLLTFVQALSHGLPLLQSAGVVCPTERPKPPVPLAEAEANADTADDVPVTLHEAAPAVVEPVAGGMSAEAGASPLLGPPCTEPEMTVSFSTVVGPDTEPAVYQLQRVVGPSEDCRISTYKLSMSGNAPVERLTVDQSAKDSSITLDYAVWSGTEEVHKVKFDVSLEQQSNTLSFENLTYASGEMVAPSGAVIAQSIENLDFSVQSGFEGIEASAPNSGPEMPPVDASGDTSAPIIITQIDYASEWSPLPITPQCPNQVVTVDKAVPPLGNQVQAASFSQRIEPYAGCQIARISVSDGVPVDHQILNGGASATLSYDVVSTETEPGRLAALVIVEQLPTNWEAGATTASGDIDIPLPVEIESGVGAAFDIEF